MSYWDSYKARTHANGDTVREQSISEQKGMIASGFTESPSYQEVYINSSPTLTGVWIVDNSEAKDTQFILSQHDNPINAGDVVQWKTDKWLIIVKDDMTDVYHKGTISKCLGELKWLNDDGFPKSAPFTYRSDSSTNFGIDNGQIIDLGNERRQLLIPSNVDTKKIKKKKRFIIDERAWKVTAVDRIKKGLVSLVLQEDDINEATDRVDLGIADYTGKVANYTISITNGETFSIRANQTIQLNAEVKNNGVIESKSVLWFVSDPAIASVNESGILSAHANGVVTVTAKLEIDQTVMDSATVNVEFSTVNNYSIELNSSLDVLVNTSKTFTAVVKNNMIVDPSRTVQWAFYADDGVSPMSAATMTFSSTTQFTLKGVKVGYVKVKATLVGSSPALTKEFRIKVESLLG